MGDVSNESFFLTISNPGAFNPNLEDPLPSQMKKQLVLKIISGQQLPKPKDSMLGDRGEVGLLILCFFIYYYSALIVSCCVTVSVLRLKSLNIVQMRTLTERDGWPGGRGD